MSTVTYQREKMQGLWEEVYPLLVEHWQEIAEYKDIILAPDIQVYEAMENADMLRIYTARRDGVLLGYAAYVLRTHIHYRDSLQAQQDVLFLRKEYRQGRVGLGLIKYADEQLTEAGVQVVYHHSKVAHDFGPLLEHLGYKCLEKIYAKRLN